MKEVFLYALKLQFSVFSFQVQIPFTTEDTVVTEKKYLFDIKLDHTYASMQSLEKSFSNKEPLCPL